MDRLELYRSLAAPAGGRILFAVIDGLGGLPHSEHGQTELEAADTPSLDRLARHGECGLITPVAPGVTPGSGPAHIALFGYDPVRFQVGRGVLAALGVGFALEPGDVAARINFCTLDGAGNITDRRAGRIADADAAPLAAALDEIELPDTTCFVRHVKQYRACVVLRGTDLGGNVADTDPQRTGVPPLQPLAADAESDVTARLAERFVATASEILSDQPVANGVLLRGFDTYRPLPSFEDLYSLQAVGVAVYPMYLGAARLAGMEAVRSPDDPDELFDRVVGAADADFVFLHYKPTDSRGEDGDFDGKVAEIERADALLGRLVDGFDVVMVTGDHSTPSTMRSHSWHPVPVLIHSGTCRHADVATFCERECLRGSLGELSSVDVLPLVLAHAGRLRKFGA